jgi:hypothetical protein
VARELYPDHDNCPKHGIESGCNCKERFDVPQRKAAKKLILAAIDEAVRELSWQDISSAIAQEKPDVHARFSLAELVHIARRLNEARGDAETKDVR